MPQQTPLQQRPRCALAGASALDGPHPATAPEASQHDWPLRAVLCDYSDYNVGHAERHDRDP